MGFIPSNKKCFSLKEEMHARHYFLDQHYDSVWNLDKKKVLVLDRKVLSEILLNIWY